MNFCESLSEVVRSFYSELTNGAIHWNPLGKLNFKRVHLFQLSYGLPRFMSFGFCPCRGEAPCRRRDKWQV